MKPSSKAIKKSQESMQKRKQLELDQMQFNMCLDERICPKCAELLDIAPGMLEGYEYTCTNSVCDFTHYRDPTIVPA